ncbi:MAG: Ig-like domain-containing protein, partial [Burkholderiaceae bacterium]|nr:Ig-like domain-containing protein [Burkholderiaceae bacterium]
MALNITVTDKATHEVTTVTGQEVTLPASAVVELQMSHAQVKALARKGNDLVITTVDGQEIVIRGFFVEGQSGGHNDLVFQDDGGLWLMDWSGLSALPTDHTIDPAAANDGNGAFASIDSIDPLLSADTSTSDSSDSDSTDGTTTDDGGRSDTWLPLALALGGFATALQSSSSGSGGGGSATTTPPGGGGTTPTAPPSPTVTGTPNPEGTMTVTGTGQPGDTITATFPDGTTVTTIAGSDGSYTITSTTVQTTGDVSVTDTNTSTGLTSQPTVLHVIDNVPPEPPVVDTITANSDGTVTVSGKAEAHSTVTVTWSDGTTTTATTDANGNFTVHSVTAETGNASVTATDQAGNVSHETAIFIGTVTLVEIVDDRGISHSDMVTWDNTLYFNGALPTALAAGQQVQINLDDGTGWHTATITGNGLTWTYDNSAHPLADNTYQVTMRIVDASGAVVASLAPNVYPVLVDTISPTESIQITSNANVHVATSDASVTVSGTIGGGPLADGSQPGVSKEYVQIKLGNTDEGTATVDASGNWSFTFTNAPAAGTYLLQVQVMDYAGNPGQPATQQVTFDTPVPNVSIDSIVPDSYLPGSAPIYASDFITNFVSPSTDQKSSTLTFNGTLATALTGTQVVQVSMDGGKTWTQITAANGTVNGTEWSYTVNASALPDNNYQVEVQVLSAPNGTPVGNPGERTLVIDTTAPTESIALTEVNGHTPTQGMTVTVTTSTGSVELMGTLGAQLADGTAPGVSAEQMEISTDGGKTWKTVDQVNGTDWYDTAMLSNGSYQVEMRVVDVAGNIGSPTTAVPVTVTGVTQMVSITGINPDSYDTLQTQASLSDYVTNLVDPTSGKPDATLTVNGALTSALTGTQVVQVNLGDGNGWHTAQTASGGTTWSYVDSTPQDGKYTVQARIVDPGNDNAQVGSIASQAIIIDTTPPTETPSFTSVDGTSADSSGVFTTSSTTLSVMGSLDQPLNSMDGSHESVQVSFDDKTWQTATASDNGKWWAYNDPTDLALGTYTM